MRNPNVCYLAAVVALALAACGPSSKELASAKSARYKADKLVLFNAAKAATEEKYHLNKSDETTLGFETVGRWYTPEGQLANEGNTQAKGGGYNSLYPDKSINIVLVVKLVADGDAFLVDVSPVLQRYNAGSPQPEPLKEDDISVPGWAHGKIDQLAFDIHAALKQYEVKTVPGAAPPPTAPAPAAPPPATPAPAPAAQ